VMADGVARTKGELSGAVTPRLDERLCPWCEGCGVRHPQDALFRYATLQAGLVVTQDGAFVGGGFEPGDPEESRRELVDRFLRLCGPAGHQRLAAWLAVQPATARRLLRLVDDLVEATVEGRKAWTRPHILDRIGGVRGARAVRLLPPHDPLTELADRELVVPDPARRREVWRATVNPGVLVVSGEIAGTYRLKVCSDKISVTVRVFDRPDPATQAAGEKESRRLAGLLGRTRSDTWYEAP
jgi:hypothetical protein